jgi:hypothetical protein
MYQPWAKKILARKQQTSRAVPIQRAIMYWVERSSHSW